MGLTNKNYCHIYSRVDSLETYLCFLLIEVVDNDPDKEIQGEEGAKDDEDDKVKVHVDINFIHWLGFYLHTHTYKHTHLLQIT